MCTRCPPKVHFSGKTTIQTGPQIHAPSQEADPVEDFRKITLEAMLKDRLSSFLLHLLLFLD